MPTDGSAEALVTRVAVALYGEAHGFGHLEAERYWPGEASGTHMSYRDKARLIIGGRLVTPPADGRGRPLQPACPRCGDPGYDDEGIRYCGNHACPNTAPLATPPPGSFTVWRCPGCGSVSGQHGLCRNAFAEHGVDRPTMVPVVVREVTP